MLILDTFFRDGVFVPNEPITGFTEGELVFEDIDNLNIENWVG